MSLENLTGPNTGFNDLVPTNPDGTDPVSEGDNHIRGVKNVTVNVLGPMVSAALSLPVVGSVLEWDGTKYRPRAGAPFSKNFIINGLCRVAQRGSITSAAPGVVTYGGCDRIAASHSNATTFDLTQITTALAGVSASGYAQRATVTFPAAGTVAFHTRLEARDSKILSGKQITLAANALVGTPVATTATLALYKASAPDNFAAPVLIVAAAAVNLTIGVAAPLVLSQTLAAADAANGIEMRVTFNISGAAALASYMIGELQLTQTAGVVQIESVDIADDFARCQRYHERGGDGSISTADQHFRSPYTGAVFWPVRFAATKRAGSGVLTIAQYAQSTGTLNNWREQSATDVPCSASTITQSGFIASATTVDGFGYAFTWTADAEL